jgi:hypothetical protein
VNDKAHLRKYSILGALTLYLDFINLFLMLCVSSATVVNVIPAGGRQIASEKHKPHPDITGCGLFTSGRRDETFWLAFAAAH